MTKQEFINCVVDFSDLQTFISEEDMYDYCDIRSKDDLDYYIDEMVAEMVRHDGWEEIRDYLDDIPIDGDFYVIDAYGGIEDISREFEIYKNDIMEEAERMGKFDEDDEEEIEIPDPQEEIWEENFPISEMYDDVSATYRKSIVSVSESAVELLY